MSDPAIPGNEQDEPTRQRRRYDNSQRRRLAARTRERIIAAGSDLAHSVPTWDWSDLTFGAVAERAGVGKRTVYRYFPTEQDLHQAILRRLEEEAGVSYDSLGLDDFADVTARVFATLSSYKVSRWTGQEPPQPVLIAEDQRRRDTLLRAITAATPDWTDSQRRKAAAALDLLWSLPSYERMITAWNLEGGEATKAITWVIDMLTDAIRRDRRPR